MKRFTLKGGYKFPVEKTNFPLKTVMPPLPEVATIPVIPTHDVAPKIIVKTGDKVKAGDIIARDDDNLSSCVLASVSGSITELTSIEYMGKTVEAVRITSDKSDTCRDIKHISKDKGEVLYLGGASVVGRSNVPTRFATSTIKPSDIKKIIINTVDAEPFSMLNQALLRDNIKGFLRGCDALHQMSGEVIGVNIVVDASYINDLPFDKYLQERKWIRLYPVKNKYPVHNDNILTEIVLGRKLADSESPGSLGCIIFDVADVLVINDAINESKPYIEHTFEVVGPGLEKPVLVKGRIGDDMASLLLEGMPFVNKDVRFIINSVMTGQVMEGLSFVLTPFVKSVFCVPENKKREFLWFLRPGLRRDTYSRAYLGAFLPGVSKKFDTNIHGEHRPCISCGWCEEACPVDGLLPHLLSKFSKAELFEEAVRFKPHKCIECGLCTYVCPAKIELMEDIKRCKQGVQELDA